MTDNEVVALILSGDKEKFGEIIERYETKLYKYLKNLTNQEAGIVEDLAEEVLTSSYINLRGFDTTKKFSSWLYRIAHNKAIDYFKKKKPVISVKTDVDWMENIASEEKLAEELEIEKETKKEIVETVNKLEIKYREVIWLYFFENKSYEEISDILQIPTTNVGVLLNRAKKKLKQENF